MPTDQDFKPLTIFNAIRLVALGIPVSKVARRFEVPHYRVRFWVQRYSSCLGPHQIAEEAKKHKPGRRKHG